MRSWPYHHRSLFLETVALKPYRLLGAAIAALLASLSAAPAAAGPIQPFLDQLVKKEQLPGAVLLVSGPQGRHIAVSGVANLKTREPVTADSRFYIASSGKLLTAAATLQMVQEKRLQLDEPVFGWVKHVKGIDKLRNIRAVTVEQLLKHRSGLAEYYTDDFEAQAAEAPKKRWSADESLAFAFGEKAQSKPDVEHNYTNTNFVLLGRLMEEVDQTSYANAVQRRLFTPLGMSASSIGAPKDTAGLAHGYTRNERNRLEDVSDSGWSAITGDGAVVTTVANYEAFLLALFRDGKVLPAKTVAHMCRPQREEPDSGYGLGCANQDTPWGDAWGHNGSIPGFNADTWFIPKLGVTVVFFTNGDYQSDDPDVLVKAVKAYLKK